MKIANLKINLTKLLMLGAMCASAATALAAPDFNITAYNYDTQPTPLPTSGTDTFRVSLGSVGDAPGAAPVQVSIQVPGGVAVVAGSFPSYCVLAGSAPVNPSTSGTQVLQCTLPTSGAGSLGGIGSNTEISYVGRAVVPSNSAYTFNACIDNIFSTAYPVTAANCQSYPGDSDPANDVNGQSLLISAANDLGIVFSPSTPENVVVGAPYTFTANITSKGLDPVPGNQVQAEFNIQPGFQPTSIAAINAASPGWVCSQAASKITCILSAAVAANPTGVLANLPAIKIPGTVVAAGGTTSLDAAIASNDSVATIADPVPANNGPVIKIINIQAGGNIKADKSFVGQPSNVTASLAVTATSTMRLTIASDAGGSAVPAGASVSDDVSQMLAKGFTFTGLPTGCALAASNIVCTTTSPLSAGSSVNFDIVITHPATLPGTPAGINVAVAAPPAGYTDSITTDNSKPAPYIVVPAYADLEIAAFEAARKVALGATITRGVGVKNNGPLPVVYGPANPLRAYGNIAPVENGGSGVATCPATLLPPWQNCTVSGTRLVFDTGTNTGTLPVGATTPPASFTSTAPTLPAAVGTGPNTQVCTGQKILDTLGIAINAGPNPPERTGVNGVNVGNTAPSLEYANDCKNARGVEYIQNSSAGDLTIAKTVATLAAGQLCDASTSGFTSAQTLAAVATNDNALCFKMVVKNDNPNRAGVTWGDGATYTHGTAKDYFISDNLPMYWGITGNAGENLPTTQSVLLNPPLAAGEACTTDITASPPVVNCNLVNLAPNAVREMYIKVSRGMLDGTFINTALTDSKNLLEPDDIPGSTGFAANSATATSVINPVVDLVVTGKSLNPNPIPVGKLGQYVFTYKNLGPNPSQLARVEDVVDTSRWEIVGTPINTRGEACQLLVGTPAVGRTTVRCDLNTTPFERLQEYQVVLQVRPLFPYAQPNNSADGFSDGIGSPGYVQTGGGLPLITTVANMPGYTNTAVIAKTRPAETERDLTNNNSSVLVKVAPPKFDLIVAKTDVGTGLNGDNLPFPAQVKYRITMVNSGESKVTGVQMVDLKPVLTSGTVPNFGATTAVTNNGAVRSLNFVSAVFEPSAQFASSGRTLPATPCTDNLPSTGQVRCLSSNNAADQYMLPGESFSWVLTFDPTPALPAIRGNLILPNRVRGASNEAPLDMTVSGRVDYDKDSVRNAVENTTWFSPMDLEVTAKTTIFSLPQITYVDLNQTVQFNIDFHNNGPSPTRRVKITENLPLGFTFISASFVKPVGSALPGVAADYPVSCTGVGQNVAVCEIGDAASTVADFVGPTGAGQLQVIAKASNWAAITAPTLNNAFVTNLNNVATIGPGTDVAGNPLGRDSVPDNNSKTSAITVALSFISGRVCQVTQAVDLAAAAVKDCPASPGGAIPNVTIKVCGVDNFGNAVGGGNPAAGADCADATASNITDSNGDWKIFVPPGTYTVVETQPAGYSDYTEQGPRSIVAVGPNAAISPGLNFGPSPDENKITDVVVGTGLKPPSTRFRYDFNFTEIVNTGLSGFVYEDLNNNGTKEPGEQGIQNAIITLTGFDFDGNPINVTTTTSITGAYAFNVPPSNAAGYTLVQTQPAGYFDGKDIKGDVTGAQPVGSVIGGSEANNSALGYSAGGNPVTAGTANSAKDTISNIVLVEALGQSQHNFGEIKTGTITGVVYVDGDGSVTKQGTEATLPSVTVTLTGTDFLGNAVNRVVQTNASGVYLFAGLLPGDYTVSQAPVPGYTHTGASAEGPNAVGAPYAPINSLTPSLIPAVGAATGGAVSPAVSLIKLGPGGVSEGNNFGERGSDLSGRVCEDLNNDGICQAAEPSIPNVTITLSGLDASGNAVTRTALTNAGGNWVINDIPAPDAAGYSLEETQPVGYLDGKQSPGTLTPYAGTNAAPNIGTTTATDVIGPAKDKITGIKFNVATSGVNYDFAEVKPASLQGFVYYDLDKDGARTAGEPGIVGVVLELTGNNDLGQPVALTTTTSVSPDGSYTFSNLRPGNYTVREIQPSAPAYSVADGTVTVGSVVYTTLPITPAANNGTLITETPSTTSGAGEGVSGIILGSGGNGSNYNFGELPLAGVSGRVFVDRNFANGTTGTYDPTTDGPLLSGGTTTITLCRVDPALTSGICPTNFIEATTATQPDGTYNFPVVPVGDYWVVETQPVGYGSSSPNIVPVRRTGPTAVTGINFADTLAEIRGTVYRDDNGSGALNGVEPGIPGVTVKLCLSSDAACATPIKTTTTSTPGGTYTFADIPAPPAGQTYFIKEEQSTVPATLQNGTTTVGSLAVGGAAPAPVGTANTLNNTINGITWTPSAPPVNGLSALGTDYNFGELPTTIISGAVILDRDFGGTQTPSDTGLPSTTTVTLCRSAPVHGQLCPPADVVASTTTTPGSGTYTFPAVTPGKYYVVETQPAGYASSSPNTSALVDVTTTPITGINFYETGARLSGTVYKDVDYSGTNNAGDIPLPSVTIRVCTTANCAAGSVVATTATSATGLYQFNDLPAPSAGQSYFVVEDQSTVPPTPTLLSDGTTTVGTFALTGTGGTSAPGTAVQSPSRFEGVTWTPPTSVQAGAPAVVGTNFNFGEIDGFDVGGKVFFDANRNGSIDSPSDTPLAGIVMTLCRVATVPCPPTSIVGTTTTNVTGDYTFPRVPPGDYFVQETQPPGYGSVPTPAAPTATDVRPIKVGGANVTGINFADTLSSIAGLVYRDDDGSQTRNGAETTMPAGITITLSGIDATGAAVTRTTVTNASGTYVFDNLRTGTYTITESQPAGFGNGGSNVGTLAGGTGSPNSNQITNIQLPANTDAPNYNFGDVPRVAGVAGTVWRDNDHDRLRDADEPLLPGWTVQVLRTPVGGGTPTLVATAVSDANGAYSITGLEAGGGYSVRFIAPGGAIFGGAVDGEQGTPISGATVARGEITNLTLTATVTGAPNVIPQQSLPVDPSGVVYDSDTRLPVPGAQVRFEGVNCPAFNPAIHLVGGAGNQNQTVGPDGFYQFLLNNGAPACQYRIVVTPPGAYQADPAIPPQAGSFSPPPRPGVALIVPNAAAPQEGQPTTYFLNFNLNPNSQDVVNNHIPLVARVRPVLFVTKVANKSKVELGDTVKYTVRVRYASGSNNLTVLKVVDTMPAGFKLIANTAFVSVPTGAPAAALAAANITGAPGAVVTYNIPVPGAGLTPGAEVELTYRVRVAVGSMQGDGINRAQARSTGTLRSNIAQAKVIVDPGVFTSDGCVAGKVFVDCNNNHIQDAEELGVPNVRLYMEDGTYFITDSEGKYNYCGLSPKSHVITVDMLTMPRGSRLTTTTNRNLGDANSIFLDVKNGQLIRADFAEGSCSNTVLEQVKARRTQGEVRSTDTEKKGQPALKWEGKSSQYPQQGTDGANQPLVVPRTTNAGVESAPEQNTPVPQMPGASSNTQGANVRNAK